MDTAIDYVFHTLPKWLVLPILLLIGVMKYAPRFIKNLIDVKELSDKDKNALLAFLKSDKQRLEAELEREREVTMRLRDQLNKLKK